ncbi:MAG: hypothetical protein K2H61_00210, partial [Muribaculaceae bacterium]|nr:hypothetical protein [Muribaculaceae bacterium]
KIDDATDRMSNPAKAIAEEAANELVGLKIAMRYAEDIAGSKRQEADLRAEIRQARAEREAGQMSAQDYREFVKATEEAIREMRIDRVEAYQSLVEQMTDTLSGSVVRAKEWREAEKERVNNIHHLANSDMQGRELRGQKKDTRMQKLLSHGIVQFFTSPLRTFDQMLRMFGRRNPNGEGYLDDHFMRSWADAVDGEQLWNERYQKKINDKIAKIFGKKEIVRGKLKSWVNYIFKDMKSYAERLPSISVELYDGAARRVYDLSQADVLYLYAVEKDAVGRATNRIMGISESVMQELEKMLDPKLIEFADWVQEELLKDMGLEVNKIYREIYGANMNLHENYFPFVRNKDMLKESADDTLNTWTNDGIGALGSAFKARKANVVVWDIQNMDFFEVLGNHIQQMCHDANFMRLDRDLRVLVSYGRFKQQINNIASIYGNELKGEKSLMEKFKKTCAIVTGGYKPRESEHDKLYLTAASGVTGSKVAGRIFTAWKQVLSFPAYWGEISLKYMPLHVGEVITLGIPSFIWAWKNMPNFRKRMKSRTTGDIWLERAQQSSNKIKSWVARYGMLANVIVDGLTASLVHGVYMTRRNKYLRWGMTEEQAHRRAIQDAEICFNKSQQSSEAPFMAPIQLDHTIDSVAATAYRSASQLYSREAHTSARNLKRIMSGEVDENFVAKQILRTMDIKSFSERFDEELKQQEAGTLPQGHIYQLGRPGGILQAAGIADLPMELSAERLAKKASETYRSKHPFELTAVKGLVGALNEPIAVFDSATRPGVKVILTALKSKGMNFVVAMEARRMDGNRKVVLDVNDIGSIYPKDSVFAIPRWITDGKLRYCEHKKMRDFFADQWPDYIGAGSESLDITVKPDNQQRIKLAEVDVELLRDAANVVNNFENPEIPEQKNDNNWSEEAWSEAKKEAKKEMRSAKIRNSVNLIVFGWALPWLWRIGSVAPLLLLGGDWEDKKKRIKEATKDSIFGPIEGLTYGDVLEGALTNLVYRDFEGWGFLDRPLPIKKDIQDALERIDKNVANGAQECINIIVAAKYGIDIKVVTNIVTAIMEASDDRDTQRETALLFGRLMNVPETQLEQLYFDELGVDGLMEGSAMTPKEIAERYAEYKTLREAPLTGGLRSREATDSIRGKKVDKVMKDIKSRVNTGLQSEELKQLLAEYDRVNKEQSRLNKLAAEGNRV